MSVSRKSPRQQSDSVPQAKQTQSTGDDPQHVAPTTTPPGGGTTGHSRTVPCSFSLTITHLNPHHLTALLEALQPANDDSGGGQRHGAYDQSASTLLDLALMLTEALRTATEAARTLKAALEEEVLP